MHTHIYAHFSRGENNKFCLHNFLNRNGEYLAEFSLTNRLVYLNTKSPNSKKMKRIRWTYIYPNNLKHNLRIYL